jgi:malonyl-CoA O-methyltransferase
MNYFKIPSIVKIKGYKPANSFAYNHLMNSFNRAASSYDNFSFLQREIAHRLSSHLDLLLLDPKVILDLGAGTGYTTALLKKHYPKARIVALDIAELALLQAKKKFKNWRHPEYICGNMGQMPLAENSVDLVFSNLALHWSINLEQALNEIRRVLRPVGTLLFSTLGLDTLKELRSSWHVIDSEIHVHDFVDMHDVGDTLLHLQYTDPVMEMEYLILTYKDLKKLFAELKATGFDNHDEARSRSLLGKIKYQKFLAEYENFRREDGFVPATFEVIYGHAKRGELQNANEANEVAIPINDILRKKA